MEQPILEKAIETVTRATKEDLKRNYEKAIELYEEAMSYFNKSITSEIEGDRPKNLVKDKCVIYSTRVQEIKDYLLKNTRE